MKTKIFASTMLAAALITGQAQAQKYDIDPAHSFVQFKVNHLGVSWLVGNFNEMSGTMEWDKSSPASSAIDMTVKTTSLDTNHKVRDGHLAEKDRINSSKYPEATFVSTGYKGDADKGVVTGTLTINGVEKEVEVDVVRVGEGNDPWGGYRVGFTGNIVFDRREFGSDSNLGPASWEVAMEVNIEAIAAK